jgi:hypothetical protein
MRKSKVLAKCDRHSPKPPEASLDGWVCEFSMTFGFGASEGLNNLNLPNLCPPSSEVVNLLLNQAGLFDHLIDFYWIKEKVRIWGGFDLSRKPT